MDSYSVASTNSALENVTMEPDFLSNQNTTQLACLMNGTEGDRKLDIVMNYIDLYLRIIFLSFLSFFAFTTNVLNITILIKQGIRSCVSLCLLCLSVTDFLSTFAGLCAVPPKILMYLNKRNKTDPYAIYFIMAYMSAILYDVANTLTAFLSIERCLCVCLPFKFKDWFTIRRGMFAIFGIYLLIFGIYMPHFLSSGLETRISEDGNSTYLALWLSEDRAAVDYYLNITVQFCLTISNMLVVGVCTLLMIISLKRSCRFQGSNTKADNPCVSMSAEKATENSCSISLSVIGDREQRSTQENRSSFTFKHVGIFEKLRKKNVAKKLCCYQATDYKHNNDYNSEKNGPKTVTSKQNKKTPSTRNVNVMKTVIVLCVICFVSNIARLVITTSSFVEPRLRFGREYARWFQLSLSIGYVFQILNCSLNIFVYYRFNKSFRTTFQRLFCCKRFTD